MNPALQKLLDRKFGKGKNKILVKMLLKQMAARRAENERPGAGTPTA